MVRGRLAFVLLAAAAWTAAALVWGPGAGSAVGADAAVRATPEAPPARAPGPIRIAEAQVLLRARLEAGEGSSAAARPLDERLGAPGGLRRFYEARDYAPAWFDSVGERLGAFQLLGAVHDSESHGLHPADYHEPSLQLCLGRLPDDPAELADCDLLFSDAWLLLASHLMSGRIDPSLIDTTWYDPPAGGDLARLLESALAGERVWAALAAMAPRSSQYGALRDQLAHYRALAATGGWPLVSPGPTLRPNDRSPRVAELRSRLAVAGQPATSITPITATHSARGEGGEYAQHRAIPEDPLRYDSELETRVRTFQAYCCLDPDGVVGARTLAQLNFTAGERALQIAANLERWRWLPQDLGEMHVQVNIAARELSAIRDGRTELRMPVVVGRDHLETPAFSGRITYLVLNPSWEVPAGMVARDILPELRQGTAYLQEKGFEVLSGWAKDAEPLDPESIDWDEAGPGDYRFRQPPGPKNPMGRIKFMFPNRHAVYLHDSPERELFDRADRTFSNGCVRIAAALDLAELLLAGSRWDRKRLLEAIETGQERVVSLPQPVPVHLIYWTAMIEEDGSLRFAEDLYDRDRRILLALGYPAAAGAAPVTASRRGVAP